MEPRTAPQTRVRRPVQLGRVATNREILMHGQQAFQRGEDASALESLTRLTGRGVRFADVHYMIGMLHEHSGETEAAIVSLQEAIRINPSYVEALLALASLHERSGDYERSRGYAERASQLSRPSAGGLDPTTRGKLANQQAALAAALVEAGERRDAIEQYRCALDRCPAFHDIRHQLGITLREAGLPAQAVQEFTQILRRRPGMLESQIQLGLTYYSMGRTPEAIREWGAVLQKDPSRDEARMYLRLVSGARHAGRVGATPLRPAADPARDLSIPPAMAVRSGAPDGAEISSWTTTELARDDSEESSG
ncbi:MAG: tetratricopeptide repeat protein [bacterium]|nr:tetratricopeptide repeat protein [bacterium]